MGVKAQGLSAKGVYRLFANFSINRMKRLNANTQILANDDDCPSQSDRCESPMMNPQARRLLRLKAGLRQLVNTSLATLGTAALCVLVSDD